MIDGARPPFLRTRAFFAGGLLLVALAALAGRLFHIQVVRHEHYESKAMRQASSLRSVDARRGDIRDVNGVLLATSTAPPEAPSQLSVDWHALRIAQRADFSARTVLELGCLLSLPAPAVADLLRYAFVREATHAKYCQYLRIEDKVPPQATPLLGAYLRTIGEVRGASWSGAVTMEKRRVRRSTFSDARDAGERYFGLCNEILGRVADDGHGTHGAEGGFDLVLRGRNGVEEIRAGPAGLLSHVCAGGIGVDPVEPWDVYLTIDVRLQKILWDALRDGFENLRNGYDPFTRQTTDRRTNVLKTSALIMDPHTGRILAFGTWPQRREALQLFGNYPLKSLRRWLTAGRGEPIFDIYEPGSVFKCFIAAKILEERLASVPGSVIWEGGSSRRVPGRRLPVTDAHPVTDAGLLEGFVQSSNIVFSILAERLGARRLRALLTQFGLGVDPRDPNDRDPAVMQQLWPQEWKDELKGPRVPPSIPPQDVTSMGFGMAVNVTMLTLARGYSVFVNGGYLVDPHIHYAYAPHGAVLGMQGCAPGAPRRVMEDEETLATMKDLLRLVVEEQHGTAHRLTQHGLVPAGLTLGGKTGTSKRCVKELGGYNNRLYTGTFICHAPAENPRYVIVTRVDVDREWPDARVLGLYYGGTTAAPIAASILSAVFRESPE